MKKTLKIIFLTVVALSFVIVVFAQNSNEATKKEIIQQISQERQILKEIAKNFLIDVLPELVKKDPALAEQALVKYKDAYSSLGQNDIVYLLGHFYTRMGENTRAISYFNSLLQTNLNEDSRKMLNLALYQQMVHYLETGNRKAARD
ncbi:MAG: hypothetical protein PHN58_06270, partial [Candidatus Cloacimonetes bacterium]|nr:hypothetical protein [Candidatus Cloacimonadota bacterium]